MYISDDSDDGHDDQYQLSWSWQCESLPTVEPSQSRPETQLWLNNHNRYHEDDGDDNGDDEWW